MTTLQKKTRARFRPPTPLLTPASETGFQKEDSEYQTGLSQRDGLSACGTAADYTPDPSSASGQRRPVPFWRQAGSEQNLQPDDKYVIPEVRGQANGFEKPATSRLRFCLQPRSNRHPCSGLEPSPIGSSLDLCRDNLVPLHPALHDVDCQYIHS